ncbi:MULTISPECIES: serine/threonine-protein kinase [unclassified Paenibacillus]|uniref:serine/threonine-protein kinase n=1 Tax=unclassified Paenibacillus TaxID=185978 RepID=UPI0009A8754B|nr:MULTISPECIES: serine/threonine-protein kinase [unclassified Paenibacillus]SLK13534.1 serine/threonine protein kinase [Paenibacillus sp. RU5A]SOC73054.1 serine/threonine protein kinase [Paenibacillus sp. RU26A]SOC75346.1 serine/threonine protein kinase [Paenibacillus sp. RU5M]
MTDTVQLELDGISFELKEPHSFEWIARLGTVFRVFDQQDSGNLSFGILGLDGKRIFVKYAGACTIHANSLSTPAEAIHYLKSSVSIYEDLAHDTLIHLKDHFATEHGYVCVFDWVEGECLHSHWDFPPPAKYEDPRSPYYRFRQLPVKTRIQAMKQILDFHIEVQRRGYVAVDFYDGSLIYDFDKQSMKICDIDLYRKGSFTNTMGRMWGSSRFMSPEEFELGAPMDGITNVFNLGAMAFSLLGGELDRSYARWDAGEALYQVVIRAVDPERASRYASVAELGEAWKKAVLQDQ